jgi:tetratricopeptide (TPR) repeat protein
VRSALVLGGALLALACATPAVPPEEAAAIQEAGGFVVVDSARLSADAQADFEQAVSLLRAERTQEGIDLLVAVTEAAPDSTAAHIDLGMAYQRAGDLVRAEASIRKALELSPGHPVALNELGLIQRKTGRLAEARSSYEQALERHPTFHFARLNLAILCDLYLADLGCAVEHYQLYAQAVPDDAKVGMWIADLRARAGRE